MVQNRSPISSTENRGGSDGDIGSDFKMKKILVVDDEQRIRELYRMELEDAGYTVDIAADGYEALDKLDTFSPDLATLDIAMPGMDGIETFKRMKKKNQDLPIIILSAYGKYKKQFGSWTTEGYVVKSADLNELLATIEKILG